MSFLKKLTTFVAVAALSLSFVPLSPVSADAEGEIMFILDASSSMLYKDGTASTRIDRAKAALVSTLSSIPTDQRVGVRVYGSKVPDTNQVDGCNDSSLISKPAANNSATLIKEVNNVQAKGWTLMSKALNDVKGDFTGEGPKTVILLSDGVDTCNPTKVCETAKSLAASGTDIKVNTLGLVVNNAARAQLQCIANNTGGTYYDVNDLSRLQKALTALTAKSVNLFTKEGIPVKGTADITESPALLADTLYSDTINGEETVYYSFDALPKQKITITVKGADNNDKLGMFNFLAVKGYTKLDGSNLAATGVFGHSERFNRGPDVVTTVYKIDTEKQKITEPQQIAFSVNVRSNTIDLPVQITVAAEGGVAPDNKTIEEKGQTDVKDDKKDEDSVELLPIILGGIGGLIAIAAITAFIIYKRRKNTPVSASPSDTTGPSFPLQ